MHLAPYLNFNGNCEAAFKFYEKCLNGKITQMVTFDSMGMSAAHIPAGWGKKLMHAQMTVFGQELMGSDAPPDRFGKHDGFSISIHADAPVEAERVFHALSENGTVVMPIQKTDWSEKFGMLTDQFGIPWMVNCAAAANATA